MKKFLAFIITAILALTVSSGAFAQTFSSDSWGIKFSLSDSWVSGSGNAGLLSYHYNTDATEKVEIFYQEASTVSSIRDGQSFLDKYFDSCFSNDILATNLSKANGNAFFKIVENYQTRRYETHNNTEYYRGEKLYMSKSEKFSDQYFYTTIFSTIQAGRLYIITYSCMKDTAPNFSDISDMLSSLEYTLAASPEPEVNREPQIGDVIGKALATDIVAEIDNHQIPSYNVDGYTYIVAEDLRFYGFSVNYDDSTRALGVNRDYSADIVSKNYMAPALAPEMIGTPLHSLLFTDIKTYLDGNYTSSCNIDGQTIIRFDALNSYGFVAYDDVARKISVNLYKAD